MLPVHQTRSVTHQEHMGVRGLLSAFGHHLEAMGDHGANTVLGHLGVIAALSLSI